MANLDKYSVICSVRINMGSEIYMKLDFYCCRSLWQHTPFIYLHLHPLSALLYCVLFHFICTGMYVCKPTTHLFSVVVVIPTNKFTIQIMLSNLIS